MPKKTTTALEGFLGEPLHVHLGSSPSTGYIWQVKEGHEKFHIHENDFISNGPGVGGGGTQSFTITPKESGKHVITFKHHRPWEKKEEEEIHEVTVHVI